MGASSWTCTNAVMLILHILVPGLDSHLPASFTIVTKNMKQLAALSFYVYSYAV